MQIIRIVESAAHRGQQSFCERPRCGGACGKSWRTLADLQIKNSLGNQLSPNRALPGGEFAQRKSRWEGQGRPLKNPHPAFQTSQRVLADERLPSRAEVLHRTVSVRHAIEANESSRL